MIIPIIDLDFFERQNDAVVQLAKCSLKQPFYCRNFSFGYFFPPNYEGLVCLIDNII